MEIKDESILVGLQAIWEGTGDLDPKKVAGGIGVLLVSAFHAQNEKPENFEHFMDELGTLLPSEIKKVSSILNQEST